MTVINPSSISGITSITMPSGDGNVLTIHTNDGVERFRIDSSGNVKVGSAATISPDGDVFFTGVCTATTLSGAASGLTGALPAIDGSALTGIAATDNVRTGILDVAGIATFRNDVNIGAAVTISESGIEASGIGITCASINGGQIGGRRNIIINGAMNLAQRSTSRTDNQNYAVDRFYVDFSGTDEAPTYAQVDVSSSATPYTLGLTRAFKFTNGNQTGGADAGDWIRTKYRIEASDIRHSGWNYTSSSSFITLSFWVKSSVAQTFYTEVRAYDGTEQRFSFPYTLTADTWTKVIKTIPGNSNLTFNDDNGVGLEIQFALFFGTDYTDSGATSDTWAAFSTATQTLDQTSTWYTTNDATWELTGVQLEVGPQATAFEHLLRAEELALCQRYCYLHTDSNSTSASSQITIGTGSFYTTNQPLYAVHFPVTMRAIPTLTQASGTNYYIHYHNSTNTQANDVGDINRGSTNCGMIYDSSLSGTANHGSFLSTNSNSAKILFEAEV